jgi:GIY-YIG catalytic domain
MEWKNWQQVRFSERRYLPSCSGIYVVTDANGYVWYVGQATNLKNRWLGRGHHRYPQLIRSHRKNDYNIYWLSVPIEQLNAQEQYYIELLKPELNGCKVKTYIPKEPLIEREIKRVLKTINKKTFLFPVIRSIVVGEYLEVEQTRCIVIAINANDFSILDNSSRKKHASTVKQAWSELGSFCGRDEQNYQCPQIPVFSHNGLRFEFVQIPELLNYLEKNPDTLNQYVTTVNFLGVQLASLNNLNFLTSISLEEEFHYKYSAEKAYLYPAAYLQFRLNLLQCLMGG